MKTRSMQGRAKKLCVVHANCQGDPLRALLSLHPQFGREYDIAKYTNYLREDIPAEQLEACDLFLYQPLGEQWNDHASDALLRKVSPTAVSMAIPNMLFKGYWPFWTNRSPMDYGDAMLDHMIDMGLEKKEILYLCLHTDLTRKYDLDAMLAESLAVERAKEHGCVVHTVDMVQELWKHEKLFNTINHPNRRLVLHVANGVLDALGMTPVPDVVSAAFTDPYPEFELPLHPQVAAYHGLDFGGPQTRYAVYGTPRTYEEYVSRYVDCRLLGVESFIAYLHVV